MHPKVSVIIPTIEEEGVFGVIRDVRRLLGEGTEIIIVDKSSDSYYDRLKKTGAIVIRQKDKGVENAIMHGFRRATGDILTNIDGDGTHDPKGLVACVRLIEEGKADMVLGNRLNNLHPGSMGPYLKFGNQLLSWLFSRLYGVKVHDILTGLFAMRKSAFDEVRDIEPYRAGNATTYAVEFASRGLRIREVDIQYYPREFGQSKISSHKSAYGLQVAANIIRQVRDYSPLLIFGAIGVVFLVLGAAVGLYVFANFLATGTFTEVGRALIAFMLVVLGFLSIFTGVMLDLMVEIERKVNRMRKSE